MNEEIKAFIISKIEVIISYALSTTVAIIIMLTDRKNKKTKYVYWKKQTFNLGFFSREYERTEDALLKQLFDENKRLEEENTTLKKESSKLSFVLLVSLFSGLFLIWANSKIEKVKSILK